ncbi:MAG: META domain-containing protein [Chitinophagaceae bacterium]|nr:META domain-containing protein [Chitinophagaceae bacterium]
MRLLRTMLLATLACGVLCTYSVDAFAQKKKKKKERTHAELENTHWSLFEMNGEPVVTPADSKEVYIKLVDKKSKLEGYTGCNLITGNYDLGKETIEFSAATTERFCTDMSTEKYVMTALNDANRYVLNGFHLMLYKDTYLLAVFEAKYYEE